MINYIEQCKRLGLTPAEIRRTAAEQFRKTHNARVKSCRQRRALSGNMDYEALARMVAVLSRATVEARTDATSVYIPELK